MGAWDPEVAKKGRKPPRGERSGRSEAGFYNGYTGYSQNTDPKDRKALGTRFRPGGRKKPKNLVQLSGPERQSMIEAFLEANPDRRIGPLPRSTNGVRTHKQQVGKLPGWQPEGHKETPSAAERVWR